MLAKLYDFQSLPVEEFGADMTFRYNIRYSLLKLKGVQN